jgi:hypothetical protein
MKIDRTINDIPVVIFSREEAEQRELLNRRSNEEIKRLKELLRPYEEMLKKKYHLSIKEVAALKRQLVAAINSGREPNGASYRKAMINYNDEETCLLGDFMQLYRRLDPAQGMLHVYDYYKDKGRLPFVTGDKRKELFINYLNEILL